MMRPMLVARSPKLFVAALLVALCFWSTYASAATADDESEGRKRFAHGQELYLQGRYLEAAQEFESGYAVAPRNGFLINIAHSYRRAGDLQKAKTYYIKLLELDPNTPARAEVESNLRSIDDALSVQDLPAPKPVAKKNPLPNPDEAFRRRVAADAATQAPAKPSESEEGGSVFGKAWFWALLLSTAAVGGVVAFTVLRADGGCNADRCIPEQP